MIARLWNHTVRVLREPGAEAARDTWGHVELAPVAIGAAPTGFNARPDQNWSGTLQDRGPGEQQNGMRRWFVDRGVDVRERDVLSVTLGPEAGLRLRVHSVVPVTAPRRVHHIEVNVEVME